MGRDTSKGINSIIIGLLDTVTRLFKDSSMPSDLLRCERSLHVLETMLGAEEKTQYQQIQDLRAKMKNYSPPTTLQRRDKFREILVDRIDIVLFIMGRKGMLPNEVREEVIDRPKGWDK